MDWKKATSEVLTKYYKNEATTAAVLAMYNALNATSAVLRGDTSDDNKVAVAQMLIDLTYGLQTNPFIQQYGDKLWPVFQVAVNAYTDHIKYYEILATTKGAGAQGDVDVHSRLLACVYAKHEIALMALLCEQGGVAMYEKSREMRDELIDAEPKQT